jgi:phosphate starvation-inducible PhoH-like protein
MLPIIDVFMEFFDAETLEHMIKEGELEIAPLAYMRGRNLGAIMIDENSDKRGFIIIADEIQNSTPEQMKMLLTRLGKNSKMIITGDLTQHDRGLSNNGLADAYERLSNNSVSNKYVTIDKFNKKGVVRSAAVQNILSLYPEDEE